MKSVRQRDTAPELAVRKVLHRLGYRFRLHRRDLPGTPDIVLPRHKVAVFVHGCFWHRHRGCSKASVPKTRQVFWNDKFRRNVERDRRKEEELKYDGWTVLIVWECEIKDREALADSLRRDIEAGTILNCG